MLIGGKPGTAQSIELIPKAEGFDAHTTDVGEEGADLGSFSYYRIILFDLRLPDMAGDEVLRTLRLSRTKTPILVLSGIPGIENRFCALGFGADDDMTKLSRRSIIQQVRYWRGRLRETQLFIPCALAQSRDGTGANSTSFTDVAPTSGRHREPEADPGL